MVTAGYESDPRDTGRRLTPSAGLRLSVLRHLALETLREPHLDNRLSGDTEALSLAIERVDHPQWEVHVHATGLLQGSAGPADVQIVDNALACVELPVELTCLQRGPLPPPSRPEVRKRA